MRVIALQHEPFEGPAGIGDWLVQNGHEMTVRTVYSGEKPPPIGDFEGLVIMGGGMSVNDEAQLPWLVQEKALVRQAVAAQKHVLGVCLGAQMIASALGAKVYRNAEREIGWFPLKLTEYGQQSRLFGGWPREFTACHWHGETFDLPTGAVQMAYSEGCRNQAFAIGERVVGLQFHVEYTAESVELMLQNCLEDTQRSGRYIQDAAAVRTGLSQHGAELLRLMKVLMERLFE